MFIHQREKWPDFNWDREKLFAKLGEVRHRQGKILGHMQAFGFKIQEEAMLQALTLDVVKSSEIEGKLLSAEQVRSSIARRLGIEVADTVTTERDVEGVIEMMLYATKDTTNHSVRTEISDGMRHSFQADAAACIK